MRAAAVALVTLPWMFACAFAGGLDEVKQETNLERRSERAMENANAALDRARDAFQAAKREEAQEAVREVSESVDVAGESLAESGKNARRSPKYFKKAELAARHLLRRIDSLKQDVDFDEQPVVERMRQHVSAFHDELIRNIMGKKK